VGVPLIVALVADALNLKPAGSEPAPIDQLYGDVPPETVQLAAYAVPTVAGPVRGVQVIDSLVFGQM
jgi:hypothetical protein